MEDWSIGVMECWNTGVLVYWNNGVSAVAKAMADKMAGQVGGTSCLRKRVLMHPSERLRALSSPLPGISSPVAGDQHRSPPPRPRPGCSPEGWNLTPPIMAGSKMSVPVAEQPQSMIVPIGYGLYTHSRTPIDNSGAIGGVVPISRVRP